MDEREATGMLGVLADWFESQGKFAAKACMLRAIQSLKPIEADDIIGLRYQQQKEAAAELECIRLATNEKHRRDIYELPSCAAYDRLRMAESAVWRNRGFSVRAANLLARYAMAQPAHVESLFSRLSPASLREMGASKAVANELVVAFGIDACEEEERAELMRAAYASDV